MEQETESGDGWQVKKRMLYRKHKLFIMTACCLFFILAVIGIFTVYQNLLNERFRTVLTDELEKNIRDQKNYISSTITDLQAVLEMLEDTDSGMLTDEWELLLHDKCVSVDYLEKQQFLDMVSSSQSTDTEKKISDRLMAGAHVVTGLGESCFTDNSSFALLNLVFKNGSFIGVLRAQVDAALLTVGNNNSDSMFQKVYTILTTADGDVVYANTPPMQMSPIYFLLQFMEAWMQRRWKPYSSPLKRTVQKRSVLAERATSIICPGNLWTLMTGESSDLPVPQM